MVLYFWLVWDSSGVSIEPWVLDKSQNGTFVNGRAVGKDRHAAVYDGDRLEVFRSEFFNGRDDVDPPRCIFRTSLKK